MPSLSFQKSDYCDAIIVGVFLNLLQAVWIFYFLWTAFPGEVLQLYNYTYLSGIICIGSFISGLYYALTVDLAGKCVTLFVKKSFIGFFFMLPFCSALFGYSLLTIVFGVVPK